MENIKYDESMEYYDGVKLTPMLRQYLEKRNECGGAILLFRLGDFYEMFFEEAKIASKVLGITLTSRTSKSAETLSKGGEAPGAPMCGVPFHAAKSYISRLVTAGHNVAICEQISSDGDSKLFTREIVKIITPGTLTDEELLEDSKNNYIMSIHYEKSQKNKIYIAIADITTGDFLLKELENENQLIDIIALYSPKEIIAEERFTLKKEIFDIFGLKITNVDRWYFEEKTAYNTICDFYNIKSLAKFGIEESPLISAAGSLIQYLYLTQKSSIKLLPIKVLRNNDTMHLDISTLNSLELTKNNRGGKNKTLLSILDKTKTPMGARLLNKWILKPLTNTEKIETRLKHVSLYYEDNALRMETREVLSNVKDIERLLSRIKDNPINSINSLKFSLRQIQNLDVPIHIDKLSDILLEIETYLDDFENFKEGIDERLDEYRKIEQNSEGLLLELEARESEKIGISKLKIKHSKLYGYTFEVPNSQKDKVPEYFIRKQTLSNTERYQTEELILIEEKMLSATDIIKEITRELTKNLAIYVSEAYYRILETAQKIAYLDAVCSFAQIAIENNYTKPLILEEGETKISKARHPVVEKHSETGFIPNDAYFDNETKVYCITGPNMSGKSTFMRSIALVHLMAQIGSYVPCSFAQIKIIDRIFTRIGASDSLSTGQSTFMVEMNEVSNILTNMSENSLIILDEIGRGTSTHDGLSVAWAVLEYIANKEVKTLFSTHYHELSKIENSVSKVKNYQVTIEDVDGVPVFLHKVVEGAASKSYGLTVAKLAGLPSEVVSHADEILNMLTKSNKSN